MKKSGKLLEAILYSMFEIESRIQHLEYLLTTTDDKDVLAFLKAEKAKRQEHFENFKELLGIMGKDHELKIYFEEE